MRRQFTPRGAGDSETQVIQKDVSKTDSDGVLLREKAMNDSKDIVVESSPCKNEDDNINHNLYNEISNDNGSTSENENKDTKKQGTAEKPPSDDIDMTPPQNVLFAKAPTDAAIDMLVSLESLPQFRSKLDALDEPFIRNFYYLIFQQKSGSTDVVELKKLISQFRGFTCDTEILKQKIFTNPGVWPKEKLLALCSLLSLDGGDTRRDMINCIYHFLNKPTAASQSSSASSVVSDEALDEESVHSTQNTFAVIERLGDIEAVQIRLDALDVNKTLKSLCFIMTNTKNKKASTVKQAISDFRGFSNTSDFDGLKERMILNAGTWSLNSLQEACELFGLDEDGTRPILVQRLMDYLRRFSDNKEQSQVVTIKKSANAPKTIVISDEEVAEYKKRKVADDSDDSGSDSSQQKKKKTTVDNSDEYVFLNHAEMKAQGPPSDIDDDDSDEENEMNFELMSNGTLEE